MTSLLDAHFRFSHWHSNLSFHVKPSYSRTRRGRSFKINGIYVLFQRTYGVWLCIFFSYGVWASLDQVRSASNGLCSSVISSSLSSSLKVAIQKVFLLSSLRLLYPHLQMIISSIDMSTKVCNGFGNRPCWWRWSKLLV